MSRACTGDSRVPDRKLGELMLVAGTRLRRRGRVRQANPLRQTHRLIVGSVANYFKERCRSWQAFLRAICRPSQGEPQTAEPHHPHCQGIAHARPESATRPNTGGEPGHRHHVAAARPARTPAMQVGSVPSGSWPGTGENGQRRDEMANMNAAASPSRPIQGPVHWKIHPDWPIQYAQLK